MFVFIAKVSCDHAVIFDAAHLVRLLQLIQNEQLFDIFRR